MTTTIGQRLAAGLSAALLSIGLLACGGTTATTAPELPTSTPSPSVAATPAPSASPTSGASLATTGRIEFKDKGFAITLPEGWTRIDLASGDLEALVAAAGTMNPAFAEAYAAQIKAMLASGLVLFAFGPNPVGGTTVNVLALPSIGISLDFLEQAALAQLKSIAQGDVETERVTLPAGEALHFRYAIAAQGVPTPPTVDQYIVVVGQSQLVVSVSNATPADTAAILDSLEALP